MKKYMAMGLNVQAISLENRSDLINALKYRKRNLRLNEEFGNK
ncbi:MAG: hypothetical protein V1775_07555 [Bacteroidota bacterium]